MSVTGLCQRRWVYVCSSGWCTPWCGWSCERRRNRRNTLFECAFCCLQQKRRPRLDRLRYRQSRGSLSVAEIFAQRLRSLQAHDSRLPLATSPRGQASRGFGIRSAGRTKRVRCMPVARSFARGVDRTVCFACSWLARGGQSPSVRRDTMVTYRAMPLDLAPNKHITRLHLAQSGVVACVASAWLRAIHHCGGRVRRVRSRVSSVGRQQLRGVAARTCPSSIVRRLA